MVYAHHWDLLQICELLNTHGLALQDWVKIHSIGLDWIAFHNKFFELKNTNLKDTKT